MTILQKFKEMNFLPGHYARKQLFEVSGAISWSHRSRFEKALKFALPFQGKKLLDYGCGDGTFLQCIHELFPNSFGVDINPNQANKDSGLNVSALSDDFYAAHRNSFDIIFCMEVIEHCRSEDCEKVLEDLYSLLKADGKLIISVPNEIGLSLLTKEFFRTIAGFRKVGDYEFKEKYQIKELFRMIAADAETEIFRPTYLTGMHGKPIHYHGHKGFNWKSFQEKLKNKFIISQVDFSPIPALRGSLNSQIWFVANKKISSENRLPETQIKLWEPMKFAKERLTNVLELRAQIFSGEKYGVPRWEWEYEKNPQGPYFIQLAVDKKEPAKLAGHYAIISYRLNMKKKLVHACQSLDTFTNPNYRNSGIFVNLAEDVFKDAQLSGVEFIFGFPNSNSFPGFVKKLGFETTFSLFYYIKPLRLGYFTKRIPGLKKWAKLRNLYFPFPESASKYIFSLRKDIPSDWGTLLEKFEQQSDCHIKRDAAYMNWRFCRCPDRKYDFLEMRKSGVLAGFSVLRIQEDSGYLVDLLASDHEAWKALIQKSCLELRKLGAECAVAYLQPQNFLEKTFKHQAFHKRGKGTPFIFRSLGIPSISAEMRKPENWFLTAGDTDYF